MSDACKRLPYNELKLIEAEKKTFWLTADQRYLVQYNRIKKNSKPSFAVLRIFATQTFLTIEIYSLSSAISSSTLSNLTKR